jgi:16S rRNA (cytosine1402-N4)-methyltransferase
MRFDAGNDENFSEYCANNNPTAKDILNTLSEDELVAIFRNYGEEPKSKAIARRIIDGRRARPLETTFDLRNIIEECTPKIHHYKTLSRIFQAIRIEVNQELAELQKTLNDIINIIIPGGRIVVIAYHSLEDRIVKQVFKENSFAIKMNKYADNSNTNQNFVNEPNTSIIANTMPKLMLLNQKPIVPSEEEIMKNPRARSAKMRVAEVLVHNNSAK